MFEANDDMAKIRPITTSLDPIDFMERGSTGFFEILVEKIAKKLKKEM